MWDPLTDQGVAVKFMIDAQGLLWLANENGDLMKVNADQISKVPKPSSNIPSNNVLSIQTDFKAEHGYLHRMVLAKLTFTGRLFSFPLLTSLGWDLKWNCHSSARRHFNGTSGLEQLKTFPRLMAKNGPNLFFLYLPLFLLGIAVRTANYGLAQIKEMFTH